MLLKSSFTRKLAVTCGAAIGFVLLYEVTILDSRYAARQATLRETTALPAPGARLRFVATAYCKGSTTSSGVQVRSGIAAADPMLLPAGTVIQIDSLEPQYNGIYTVMDVGPAVRGRKIDLYIWSCHEALRFGRRSIALTVLRLGWSPRNSDPGLIDTLFRKSEGAPRPLPARPLVSPAAPPSATPGGSAATPSSQP